MLIGCIELDLCPYLYTSVFNHSVNFCEILNGSKNKVGNLVLDIMKDTISKALRIAAHTMKNSKLTMSHARLFPYFNNSWKVISKWS